MHAIPSFRLFGASGTRNLAALALMEAHMKTTLHLLSLDDVLFVVALFAPISVVLSGALALVAAG
jgi:hypothetical protein